MDSLYVYSDVLMIAMNPERMGMDSYGVECLPVEDRIYFHIIKNRDGEEKVLMMRNELKHNKVLDWVD
jgi:hypothetical protein